MCSRAHSPGMVGAGARVPVPRCSPVLSCGRVQGVGAVPVPRSLSGVVRVLPALSRVRVAPGGVALMHGRVARTLSRLDVHPVHTLPALPRAHSLPVARALMLSRLPARAGTPVHSPVCLSHSPGVLPWRWIDPGSPLSCVRVAPGALPGVVACSRRVLSLSPVACGRGRARGVLYPARACSRSPCLHSLPARVLPFILPRWLTGGRSPGFPLSPWCVCSPRLPRRGWIA